MNFFQFLKSLDDLLYEVVSWLLFYPLTMWRSMRRPIATMNYAEDQLRNPVEDRFEATVSPPIQLLLTVLVAHGVELALIGQSALVARNSGIAALVSDDVSLILFRLVAFAIFPLVFGALTVWLRGQALTRSTLEGPFFAQCYACAPFALAISVMTTVAQLKTDAAAVTVAAATGVLAAIGFFVSTQARWFRSIVGVSLARATAMASAGWGTATAAVIGIGALL